MHGLGTKERPTFKKPDTKGSLLGLDRLAAVKRQEREEREKKEREQAAKRPRLAEEEDDFAKPTAGDVRRRNYRDKGSGADTPSHPGGVDQAALNRIADRDRRARDSRSGGGRWDSREPVRRDGGGGRDYDRDRGRDRGGRGSSSREWDEQERERREQEARLEEEWENRPRRGPRVPVAETPRGYDRGDSSTTGYGRTPSRTPSRTPARTPAHGGATPRRPVRSTPRR